MLIEESEYNKLSERKAQLSVILTSLGGGGAITIPPAPIARDSHWMLTIKEAVRILAPCKYFYTPNLVLSLLLVLVSG
jgi:hypothetical protein